MNIRFFVTGHGRSGTKWLARLLDTDSTVNVHHEPLGLFNSAYYGHVYDGTIDAGWFVEEHGSQAREIWLRHSDQGYAEVNSYLRYCVPEVREMFNAPVIAIARDGRYVVRSMMARGCYQRPNYPPIAPIVGLSAFVSCCWYWALTYRILMKQDVLIYSLESLNRDYDYLRALCDVIGVDVSKKQWRRFAGRRINTDVGEEPLKWDEGQRREFHLWAGQIQERLGYEC